ncbi:unnamed protein product [Rotaria sordida]|uniref:EGF-like domain-containing protein n=1 Tax=Rotaria sordida TaxID=392033 RepID=A0A814AJV8_9BILA|nr:unnamed protein product [Rotaria sordida]
MMDNEFDHSKESRIQRKRTSLIASLVASLQKDEHIEAKKNEQEKTGINPVVYFSLKTSTIYSPSANITVDKINNGPIEQDIITHNIKTRCYNPKVALRCNRGMNARLWLGGKKYNYRCFCPPSYYVNSLVAQLNIPYRQVEIDHSCNLTCRNNDRCMKYVNTENFFCQCHDNWSGTLCDIPTNCADYSTDSICIGSMSNQSICVCPNNKFGPRCLLTSCLSNTCQNNGRLTKKKFSCICPNEFYGTKYEYRKIRLDISFEKMANPSHILIYIGIISNDSYPKHMVMFQKLKHKQHSVTFHILEAFHIVFAKINHNYFLIVLQQYPRHFISTSISSNRQCAPIDELLNSTVMTMAYIQRN